MAGTTSKFNRYIKIFNKAHPVEKPRIDTQDLTLFLFSIYK